MQKAEQGNCTVDHSKLQEDFKNLDSNGEKNKKLTFKGDGVLQLEELLAKTDPMVEGLKADLQNSTVEELNQFKAIFIEEMNKAIEQIKNVAK
jgi:tRNA uridine 5-carbamoylmethylation protein Kti12